MPGVIDVIADDARKVMLFLGLAMLFLGGGIGAEVVSTIGLTVMIGSFFVADTVASLLRAYADEDESSETPDDPLEALRRRYARGELSEGEFERKVERLIATENLDLDEAAVERSTDGSVEREP